jgi:transketolase
MMKEIENILQVHLRNRKHRKRILEVSQGLEALHIGPAFSCLEIVDLIYFNLLNESDTFILSKGHGAMAQYAVMLAKGLLTEDQFKSICQNDSNLGGHPDRGNPGVVASTGSLGHGLPIGLGLAIANLEMNSSNHVYIVMSDGELMEGSNWEAILLAPTLKISNLTIFIDHNKSISRGRIPEMHPNFMPIGPKISSFGWDVIEADGHNTAELFSNYVSVASSEKPKAVICHTTKGKGVSFMENNPIWAYRSPNREEYEIAMNELDV